MKLWLNGQPLHELARHLQILGVSSAREPAEAPQRERRTVRVRVEFREDTYPANAALVASVRAALSTPTTPLRWEDDTGTVFVDRWVIVADDDQPENDNAQGTYFQSLTFSFTYFLHGLTTNCLPATLQRLPAGTLQDLGAVLKWSETLDVDHFDELKDPRRKILATLTCSGRFQGNTALTLDECRNGLQAVLETLRGELVAGIAFRFRYGAFDQTVRVRKFTADVDQPHHCIEWNLVAAFTRVPNEADYAWLEYDVATKLTASEGITTLGLRGRVAASSEVKARAALAVLTTGVNAVVPAAYIQLTSDTTAHTVKSADGSAFTELMFDFEYRDATTIPLTLQRPGGVVRALGVVARFADRYSSQLFDDMRSPRKRAGGLVSAAGAILMADSLTLADKRTQLTAQKAALDADFAVASAVTLTYGGIFPARSVRLVEWDCQIDRFFNKLEWTLSGQYTKYPDESNYAICEFKVGTREAKLEGTLTLTLSGRIGAPTAAAARARLTRLRAAVIPAGYTQTGEEPVEAHVSSESGGAGHGDGDAFIELTFSDEWQKTTGDLLLWTLRITDVDDLKSGYIRTHYAGSVTARGATQAAAFATALAQAVSLGAGKYDFLISSTITENRKLFQATATEVFVVVEFDYEYQRKGARTYLEVTAERTTDTFGQTSETVSGYVAAPNQAAADAKYRADVRTLAAYAGKLLLNERTPSVTGPNFQRVAGAVDQFDRYTFSFTVFLAKLGTQSACDYTVSASTNLQTLEVTSTVRGRVFAADRATADSLLATLLTGLDLGTRFGTSERTEPRQLGPTPAGGQVTAFLGLDFAETYLRRLTGGAGLIECEVTESVRFSGRRLVEKPLPGSASLFQDCGIVPGQRVVSGRCRGTTEASCLDWARKCRALLLSAAATLEEAPNVSTRFTFLPQASGTVRGDGADVLVFETTFTFTEWLPELPFV